MADEFKRLAAMAEEAVNIAKRAMEREEELRQIIDGLTNGWKTGDNVIIQCTGCGKRIWQEAEGWTTLADAKLAMCSDCYLKVARAAN